MLAICDSSSSRANCLPVCTAATDVSLPCARIFLIASPVVGLVLLVAGSEFTSNHGRVHATAAGRCRASSRMFILCVLVAKTEFEVGSEDTMVARIFPSCDGRAG